MDFKNLRLPDTPVTPDSSLPLRESEEIQGNILAGFRKDHQVFMFLGFHNTGSSRLWLEDLWPYIATTRQVSIFNAQFSNARRNRGGGDPENLKAVWTNIAFTSHGLLTLNPSLIHELDNYDLRLRSFKEGPAARAAILGDNGQSDPDKWIFGGSAQQPIDAVLTIAADDPLDLEVDISKMRELATSHGISVIFEQRGETLSGHRRGFEHFGFKDGISQPGIIGYDPVDPRSEEGPSPLGHIGSDMIAPGEFILGYERQPILGVSSRPRTYAEWMRNGSFQVFRRLEQDVPSWWAQVIEASQSVSSEASIPPDALGARLIGRWRSGTPIAHGQERDGRSARRRDDDNSFDYSDDPRGEKTPLFSHIRKMNPRNEGLGSTRRRILRRGIPFGPTFDPSLGRGHGLDAERGILFNAFMASIEDQFEFLQRRWANGSNFPPGNPPNQNPGPDPVIGAPSAPLCLLRTGLPHQKIDYRRFVHTTGAIYAFSPSITTLKELARNQVAVDSNARKLSVLRYTFRLSTVELDPAKTDDIFSYELLQNIYQGLVRLDVNTRISPCLAEEWTLSDDRLTYTFRLRKDAHFHRPYQQPVTSEDVKYSLERALSPETQSPAAINYLEDILGADDVLLGTNRYLAGIKIYDEHTLSITLRRPRVYFLHLLTCPPAWVVCREAIEAAESFDTRAAIGTGPFTLHEYEPHLRIVLAANECYYGGRPALTHIERPVLYDHHQELEMYTRGEVDLCYPTIHDFIAVREDPALSPLTQLYGHMGIIYLVLNPQLQPLFRDLRVRRALAHAIDRNSIVTQAGQSTWTVAEGIVPPSVPNHRPPVHELAHDPARAYQLLEETGLERRDFTPLIIQYIASDPQLNSIAVMLQEQIQSALGIPVSLQEREGSEYFQLKKNSEMALYIAGWVGDYPDPQNYLSTLLRTGARQNYVGYSNPEFDHLCDEADAEIDEQRRAELYQRAEQIAIDEVAILPLVNGNLRLLRKEYLRDFRVNLVNFLPHEATRIGPY